jgi:hypothetical protein
MIQSNSVGAPQKAASINVAYTAAAGTTAAVSSVTNTVRCVSTTDCYIEISEAGTAATAASGLYLVALVPEYFICPPNAKVSAIQVAAAGTLYVTPF